jgi:hypothetical protein
VRRAESGPLFSRRSAEGGEDEQVYSSNHSVILA